jgi:lysophospholipase L1-like esterase
MLARLDKDVISKKPEWMTLSCGVNDVWHGARGVPLEDYKKNITEIVDKCQAANIKVMILTSTMIKEDQSNPENQKLEGYNAFLRELAGQKKCLLADLNADMQAALKAAPEHKGNYLTRDGVHMNPLGNQMMATGVLKGFGLSEDQLMKAKEAWAAEPAPKPKK